MQKVRDAQKYRGDMEVGRISEETKDKLAALSIGWERLGESNRR